MRVGLLGGSFNPPHAGHVHVSEMAIRALGLDCVWWLVTPQNPLKSNADSTPLQWRMDQCCALLHRHPRIIASDLEAQMRTTRTIHTLKRLKRHFPGTDFVFLMGSDLEPQFHRWTRWRDIPDVTALAILPRPPALEIIRHSRLSCLAGQRSIVLSRGSHVPLTPNRTYRVQYGPAKFESSTEERYKQNQYIIMQY